MGFYLFCCNTWVYSKMMNYMLLNCFKKNDNYNKTGNCYPLPCLRFTTTG
jgi:hypothetical protein